VLLDALARTITGASSPLAPAPVLVRSADPHAGHVSGRFGFEVQYLLDAPNAHIAALRDALARVGDSVAVVAVGDEVWNVHAHVDDVGAAIEAGVDAGRPRHISVVRFDDQVSAGPRHSGAAVVAVAPGRGFGHLFATEGVRVVEAADGAVPPFADVVASLTATGAAELVVLAHASGAARVAEAAAAEVRAHGCRVAVVPIRSPVQGLAAIAVHDASRRFDDDVVAMAEAAAATRHAEVTIAAAEALTGVGICQPGDVLGLIDGDVVEVGRGLLAVAFNLVDRLLGVGAELMTVVVSDSAPPRTGQLIEAHIRSRSPLTDVAVYAGGRSDHPVIIGVE